MGLIDNLKTVATTVSKMKDPALMEQVMTLQISVLDLQERNRILEEENAALKKSISIKGALIIEHGVYFEKAEHGNSGPYCTRCWDVNNKLVTLKVPDNGYAQCPECKNGFDYLHSRAGTSNRGFRA